MIASCPRLSFIVPVRDDAARLEVCLTSLRANSVSDVDYEIVVADNGSIDNSVQVARRHGARVFVIPDVAVAELRNRAAREAAGEVLAFIDADNEIGPGWAKVALELLGDTEVAIVGAQYSAPPGGTWVQRAYGRLRGVPQGRHDTEWLGSGNLALPATLFGTMGGFDTSLETCEDVDLCQRTRARGLRVVSDARLASVHHGDPATLGKLFRGELWRGRDNLRVSLRPPTSWRTAITAAMTLTDTALLIVGTIGLGLSVARPLAGATLVATAIAGLAAGALFRVARIVARGDGGGLVGILQLLVVVGVYDLARALALVMRAPHRVRQPETATP